MKARCPKNKNHKTFLTVAHVMQEWKVDAEGNFLEAISDLETSFPPSPGNIWTCAECGASAIVEEN